MRLRNLAVVLVGLGATAAVAAVSRPPVARACGGFFRATSVPAEKRPSLAREKVLLIHDADKGQQHFVREVAFERAQQRFGFVVPTPSRPSVTAVKDQPFTKLRNAFTFHAIGRTGRGGLGGGGKGSAGVTVLEKKKVGSFTAFVLAATDEQALADWLAKNDLVSSTEADAWLAHYVRMGFFYVAMRYDPPRGRAKGKASIAAETIRISFDSPLPYYPYLEPIGTDLRRQPRLMELWYVGTDNVVPVALRDGAWVRPLREGQAYGDARAALEGTLEDELESLLPDGPLVLQTFQDQKFSRMGFGDIVFALKDGADKPQLAQKLEPMLAILDPALTPEAE